MRAVVGVISDTHGLLRPEAVAALQGSDHIVHAGDVGRESILHTLSRIAPVTVVRGNVDTDPWTQPIPMTDMVEIAGARLYVIHILEDLDIDPRTAEVAAVITGHTHQPKIEHRDGVLFLNPGAAGARRFHYPVSVAKLLVEDGKVSAGIITLDVE